MPKDKETSNHPCHFLSLPSARRFWCRHCMSVFEDAITRWRHSRTCRYGVVTNFMRRRELEAKALQNTTKPNPIEARLEQSVEEPTVSLAEASAVEGEASTSSNQNNGQDDKGNPFRCFICHSQFSSLEEMRHHVKFPCNHKKAVAEDNQAAMTIYIDEFTDRSRPWDPAPQPQQEEVYTSEFVPSVETPQAIHANLEVATEQQEESVIPSPQLKKQENITPTNIYVNEQGETVIEVENLDLNSEGGELSLAHLLTQLSQQGIVFDKSKTGQMQARPEMTVSDPSSGKIYTTTPSLNYQSVVKQDEDEGQPTAEDAANTLAQLAGFRGFRSNQELYEGAEIISNQLKPDQHIIQTAQGYTYSTTVPEDTVSGNAMTVSVQNGQPQVNYEYEYYPSTQASTSNTDQHITIQSVVQPGAQEYENVKMEEEIVDDFPVPVHFYEERSSSHEVTYITTEDSQRSNTTSNQTLESQDIGVEGQRLIIDHGTGGPVIIQQYGVDESGSKSQHFVNFQLPLPNVSEAQTSTQEIFQNEQHSSQSLNNMETSQEVLCSSGQGTSIGEPASLTISSGQTFSHTVQSNIAQPHGTTQPGEHIVKISEYTDEKESDNNGEEFAIQTVSLQEIVEAESSNSIPLVGKSGVMSAENSTPNTHIIHSVDNNHLHSVTIDNSSQSMTHGTDATGSLDGTTQSDVSMADKFVISSSESSLENNTVRQPMPIFVVSTSGLQLVSTEKKNVVSEVQPADL